MFCSDGQTPAYDGTAVEIEAILKCETSRTRMSVGSLLHWSTATGNYLSRLADKRPDRVKSRTVKGIARYTIAPPARETRPIVPSRKRDTPSHGP